MDRREFVKKTMVAGMACVCADLLSGCHKSNNQVPAAFSGSFTLDLSSASNASLKQTGGSVYSNNVIVLKTGSGYLALSAICTHQGCTVNFNQGTNRLVCPCHSGVFDLSGSVVSGPPPSALRVYSTSVNGNTKKGGQLEQKKPHLDYRGEGGNPCLKPF
jgi:cytochrome b6-f complex iron-sulfur subunit